MTKTNPSESAWYKGVSLPTFPKLTGNSQADAVIIGGGLTGLLCAYLLAKKGKQVVLLEAETIGGGATARTTGFLTQSIDTHYTDLRWMLGEKRAKLVVESHGEGIDLLEKIITDEHIDCEFMRCDNIIFAGKGKDGVAKALSGEQEAAHTFGLHASIEPASFLPFANAGSLRLKNQAKYHPLKFLAGLAGAAQRAGAKIHEHSEVSQIERKGDTTTVHAGNERVTTPWVMSASYEPFAEPWGIYFKKAMYMSYVMELRVQNGALQEATYEDTENPYHYFRVDGLGSHDRIIIGGEDHRLDFPIAKEKNFAALEKYITATFPSLSYDVSTRWTGHVLESIDGLAYIGPYKNARTWYAFGFSGNGMTYAPIAAMMFCEAVMGQENAWRGVYDVGRIAGAKSLLVKGLSFASEFMHGALVNTFAGIGKPKGKE